MELMIHRTVRTFLLMLLLTVSVGCSYTVSLKPSSSDKIMDDSGLNEKQIKEGTYERILLLPADAEYLGRFNDLIAIAERELLKRDLQVIDPSILGNLREFLERDMTTTELAIKAGKESNADAVIVIGRLEFLDSSSSFGVINGRKYYKTPGGLSFIFGGELINIDRQEYEMKNSSKRFYLGADTYHFEGKLVDVENGYVPASYNIYIPFVNIAEPYEATVDPATNQILEHKNYKWNGKSMKARMTEKARTLLFNRIAETIVNPQS